MTCKSIPHRLLLPLPFLSHDDHPLGLLWVHFDGLLLETEGWQRYLVRLRGEKGLAVEPTVVA